MRLDTELSVNLGHLKSNIELLRKEFLQDQKIVFMIKANAYGHGLTEIAKYSYENCRIDHFGVAALAEAIAVRKSLPESDFKLWVFSELNLSNLEQAKAYRELEIIPVISHTEDLETYLKHFSDLPLILKFNTGMNRLGLDSSHIDEVLGKLKVAGVDQIHHLMTHFSSSYFKLKENDRTHKQYDAFKQIKEAFIKAGFRVEGTSVSNSGALEQKFGLEETHVRPGLMLYGPQSVSGSPWKAKIVSSLKSRIVQLREIKKGTPIGYGGHISHADGTIAYLPIGYGDGFLTYYSGLEITHKGAPAKVLGRVNMDLIQLFFEKPSKDLSLGDTVELWNEEQRSVERISHFAKTIPYQIFTSISPRVSRRYYS